MHTDLRKTEHRRDREGSYRKRPGLIFRTCWRATLRLRNRSVIPFHFSVRARLTDSVFPTELDLSESDKSAAEEHLSELRCATTGIFVCVFLKFHLG